MPVRAPLAAVLAITLSTAATDANAEQDALPPIGVSPPAATPSQPATVPVHVSASVASLPVTFVSIDRVNAVTAQCVTPCAVGLLPGRYRVELPNQRSRREVTIDRESTLHVAPDRSLAAPIAFLASGGVGLTGGVVAMLFAVAHPTGRVVPTPPGSGPTPGGTSTANLAATLFPVSILSLVLGAGAIVTGIAWSARSSGRLESRPVTARHTRTAFEGIAVSATSDGAGAWATIRF